MKIILFKWFFLSTLLFSSGAFGIEVEFRWRTILKDGVARNIQFSTSSEFKSIVLEKKVLRSELNIDLPLEGVYHWRVYRTGVDIKEQPLLSGSFILLDKESNENGDSSFYIEWDSDKDADRYVIRFFSNEKRLFSALTFQNQIFIKRQKEPVIINIAPFLVHWEIRRLNKLKPHLKMSEFRLSQHHEQKILDKKVEIERENKESLVKSKEKPKKIIKKSSKPLAPLIRRSIVGANIIFLNETYLIKRDDQYDSAPAFGLAMGAMAEIYTKRALFFSASFDSHGSNSEFEDGGTDEPSSKQKRLNGFISFGADLLNLWSRVEKHSLNLSLTYGVARIPIKEDNTLISDFGVQLGYSLFLDDSTVSIYIIRVSNGSSMIRALFEYQIEKQLSFLSGFFNRETYGKVDEASSRFFENGIFVGVGYNFDILL